MVVAGMHPGTESVHPGIVAEHWGDEAAHQSMMVARTECLQWWVDLQMQEVEEVVVAMASQGGMVVE